MSAHPTSEISPDATIGENTRIWHHVQVREHARISDNEIIMTCVAMGFPNDSFSANHVVSHRRPVDDTVSFVGFDG